MGNFVWFVEASTKYWAGLREWPGDGTYNRAIG